MSKKDPVRVAIVRCDSHAYWFAPYLDEVDPAVLATHSEDAPTRQEVHYFGPPAGDLSFQEGVMPIWSELGEKTYYGIPGNENRGFKVALDKPGPNFDPTKWILELGKRFFKASPIANAGNK